MKTTKHTMTRTSLTVLATAMLGLGAPGTARAQFDGELVEAAIKAVDDLNRHTAATLAVVNDDRPAARATTHTPKEVHRRFFQTLELQRRGLELRQHLSDEQRTLQARFDAAVAEQRDDPGGADAGQLNLLSEQMNDNRRARQHLENSLGAVDQIRQRLVARGAEDSAQRGEDFERHSEDVVKQMADLVAPHLRSAMDEAGLDDLGTRLENLEQGLRDRIGRNVENRIRDLRRANPGLDPDDLRGRLQGPADRAYRDQLNGRIDSKVNELRRLINRLDPLKGDPRVREFLKRLQDAIDDLQSKRISDDPTPADMSDLINRLRDQEARHGDDRAAAEDDDHRRGPGRDDDEARRRWRLAQIDAGLRRIADEDARRRAAAAAARKPRATPGNGKDLTPITVNAQTITITFRDHGTEDGDIIDILLNGKVIKGGITLTNAWQSMTVSLTNGANVFGVRAVNEGRIGPNTATVRFSNVVNGNAVQAYEIKGKATTSMQITVSSGPPA